MKLVEGEHFYQEGGYTVFTSLFLLLRGYCCESGCRHCPYDEKGWPCDSFAETHPEAYQEACTAVELRRKRRT